MFRIRFSVIVVVVWGIIIFVCVSFVRKDV